ncbi:MAG TPA: TM0106 family RecB-like putative nuclease, partial [Polyangiaceae bacterium]
MYRSDTVTVFSATDLSAHSECEHRTVLELSVLLGELERPGQNELSRDLLERRGLEHERRVLEFFAQGEKQIVTVTTPTAREGGRAVAIAETEAAMGAGADVIYQGVFQHGAWLGRPDFLVRTAGASKFGAFQYELVDAKLAREMRARAVLQLCAYSELLTLAQGAASEFFWIAPGTQPLRLERLAASEYLAYYRRVRGEFEAFARDSERAVPYPEPVEHCEVCPWWKRCEERRRIDDHLSLVAGITRRQRERLVDARVERVQELGALPRAQAIAGIRDEALARVREQARLQVAGRAASRPLFELLARSEERAGLELLPEPSPGDLFLDLEGDAFVAGDGLEYLFGLLELGVADDFGFGSAEPAPPKYHAFWASTRADERRAFEAVVDRVVSRRSEFPGMHVYHFGHRENEALKRLASRHATRSDALDEFLRAGVLVDLHRVTRQGIRASVESYSLKQLEPLYDFKRRVVVRQASAAMQHFVWWLETGESALADAALRDTIQRYNEDDCVSTWRLRDWLEKRRTELTRAWGQPPRRPPEQ